MNDTPKEYDVALSFAGEQREYVREVAAHLSSEGVKVYFDEFDTETWGRDLAVHFDNVFRKWSRFVVPFISKDYPTKAWPRHELRSALARALEVEERYILPVRFDNTDVPGLPNTTGYADARKLEPKEIVEKIMVVLGEGKPGSQEKPKIAVAGPSRVPRIAPTDFNPYAEAEGAIAHLRRGLTERAKALEQRGFVAHTQDREGGFKLRIMRSGQTVYRLDVWVGGSWGDNTICFSSGGGGYVSEGSTNAHGTMEWDRTRDLPVVKLFSMSLLPDMGREYRLTSEELAEAVWETICDQLERAAR